MKFILIFSVVVILEIFLQSRWIRILNHRQVTLAQKAYGIQSHMETKSSTPSMGGIVFIAAALASIPLAGGFSDTVPGELALFWFFPILSAAVGFADDWIKFSKKSSEGFPSLFKLAVQVLIVLPWVVWIALSRGINLWPEIALSPWLAVPLASFLAIGMLNAVNVTDGLDGLAAGACVISMAGALLWLPLRGSAFYGAVTGLALCAAFLWHNAYPAKVFMGDVGSHFIAGLIVSTAIHGGCLIALIPLGFLYGLEILSVSVQLTAIHGFKKKVFLMSPVHHHFELLGWSENHIVTRFWLIHGAGLAITAVLFSSIFGN
jgi:phospho-N-acetylmuramoyl-pentapeptide-transferase